MSNSNRGKAAESNSDRLLFLLEKKQSELWKSMRFANKQKSSGRSISMGEKGYKEARKIIGQAIVDALRE